MSQPVPECDPLGGIIEEEADWMEIEVIMGFRVWQLMFLALAGFITVVVLLCCFMKCRVPRTKQEIEADFKRKEITKRFRFLLDKVQIEDTSLRTALEKVTQLYQATEKLKRQKKKKDGLEESEVISFDSNELFADEKLTIFDRIKRILRLQREDESDGEESTRKSEVDQSEAKTKEASDSEEDDEDTISSTTRKVPRLPKKSPIPQQISNESQESSGSQKPDRMQSTLTLLQDSPPRTQESSSKLTLLQDSPPRYSPGEDTPPGTSIQQLIKKKSSSQDSEQSVSSEPSKQKTDSQESRESGSRTNTQKSDSQESRSSSRRESTTSSNNNTLLKEFARRENNTLPKETKNRSFHKAKKSFSKDSNKLPTNDSRETSFYDTNPKFSIDGEIPEDSPT